MSQSNDNLEQKVDKIGEFSFSLLRSLPLLRWIGYGLLLLFFFDLLETLIPPQFLNPEWEFRTIGGIIERIVIPLTALLFIFYGENHLRSKLELVGLKILSWLTLVSGILLLLLIPLCAVDTLRINTANNAQINTQLQNGLTTFQKAQESVAGITEKQQMQALLAQMRSQGVAPKIEETDSLDQVKQKISQLLDQSKTDLQTQSETVRKEKRMALLKSSVKWNLGALVSGFLLITTWRLTKWAR